MIGIWFNFFQVHYRTGKANVVSIDTPWKTICSAKSGMAGLIMPDDLIKKYGGKLCVANEKFKLPYSLTIESVKSNSLKRKHTED